MGCFDTMPQGLGIVIINDDSSSQDSDSDVVPCHQALPDASMDAWDAYWENTCITFKLLIEGGVLCVASFEQSLVIPRED